ncbi:MAG: helix-turn-helix domain-containing protein [Arachidicoccus sp.]|nr:helix-turn-helix domain-containing protein [Arachidicoccus sp.]
MHKENSSDALNRRFLFKKCELNTALNIISGRWKAQIIHSIHNGHNRFHLLQKELTNISEPVLGRQLKEIETQGIIIKKEIPETTPTGIEYLLTGKGERLIPILDNLCNWIKENP